MSNTLFIGWVSFAYLHWGFFVRSEPLHCTLEAKRNALSTKANCKLLPTDRCAEIFIACPISRTKNTREVKNGLDPPIHLNFSCKAEEYHPMVVEKHSLVFYLKIGGISTAPLVPTPLMSLWCCRDVSTVTVQQHLQPWRTQGRLPQSFTVSKLFHFLMLPRKLSGWLLVDNTQNEQHFFWERSMTLVLEVNLYIQTALHSAPNHYP